MESQTTVVPVDDGLEQWWSDRRYRNCILDMLQEPSRMGGEAIRYCVGSAF